MEGCDAARSFATTEREEHLLSLAIDCAFAVHRETGPGFREKIYQTAYCLELDARGISFECERKIDVRYKQWVIPVSVSISSSRGW